MHLRTPSAGDHVSAGMFSSTPKAAIRHARQILRIPVVTACLAEEQQQGVLTSTVREVIRVNGVLETVDTARLPIPAGAGYVPVAPVRSASSMAAAAAVATEQQSATTPAATLSTPASIQTAAAAAALPSAAPVVPPMTNVQLQQLVDLIHGSRNVVAITGAGCSTEAGIPDYRGPQGAYTRHGFKPMTHQQFMAGQAERARYFARSFFGWHEFAHSQPSGAHIGLARLVHNGWVSHVITQNVDRLHHKAGTPADRVLELHGTTHEVGCLNCGTISSRHELQARLAALNSAAAEMAAQLAMQHAQQPPHQHVATTPGLQPTQQPSSQPPARQAHMVPVRRPDGDVELQDAGKGFVVPTCECGGVLKPRVVFFGDNIPQARAEQSKQLAGNADLLLVVGSSLMVYSAYRLVDACKRHGGHVVLVNVGSTRADQIADLKLEVLAGEAMMRVATHPQLLLPRI